MRAGGLSFYSTHSFLKPRSKSASNFNSLNTHRANNDTGNNKERLIRDLDKKQTAINIHDYENSDLSDEEIRKRQINAKKQQNTFKATTSAKSEGYFKLSKSGSSSSEKKLKAHLEYNYSEI